VRSSGAREGPPRTQRPRTGAEKSRAEERRGDLENKGASGRGRGSKAARRARGSERVMQVERLTGARGEDGE
jgi:hypothetical protein